VHVGEDQASTGLGRPGEIGHRGAEVLHVAESQPRDRWRRSYRPSKETMFRGRSRAVARPRSLVERALSSMVMSRCVTDGNATSQVVIEELLGPSYRGMTNRTRDLIRRCGPYLGLS
jgi:hypothetical protein